MRICTRCGIEKPPTEYYKHAKSRDGLQSRCKACQTDLARDRYRRTTGKRQYEQDWNDTGRRCTRCDTFKPWDQFPVRRTGRNGRRSWCSPCGASRQRELRAADPQEQRRKERETAHRGGYHYRKRYGFDRQEYERRAAEQEGKCFICGVTPRRLVVDHCHDCGHSRKLLCDRCNQALHAIETPGLLELLAEYVAVHRSTDEHRGEVSSENT